MDKVKAVGPHDGVSVFVKGGRDQSLRSLPCEDRVRRQMFASQKESPHEVIKLIAILILDFQAPRTMGNRSCLFTHPVYGILLYQPQLRE